LLQSRALVALLGLCACQKTVDRGFSPPPGSHFSAVLIRSADATAVAQGELVSDESEIAAVAPNDASVWIVAYPDSLMLKIAPAGGWPPRSLLFEATGCAARLPDPVMVVPVANTSAQAPPMSSPLLTCPSDLVRTATQTEVDERCSIGGCTASVVVSGCEIAVSAPVCLSDGVRGRIWPDGSLCIESGATCTSSTAEVDPPWGRALCAPAGDQACTIELLKSAGGPGLILAARAQVIDAPAYEPLSASTGDFRFGYLGDVAVLGDRLVVATNSGEAINRFCTDAYDQHTAARATDFRFFDLELHALGPPVAAPRCTEVLLAAPAELGGFLGITGSPTVTLTLQRFLSDGTRVATSSIALTDAGWLPVELVQLGSSSTVAALVRTFEGAARVVLIDLSTARTRTIELTSLTQAETADPYAMVTYEHAGRTFIAVNDNQSSRVLLIDPSSGRAEALVQEQPMHFHSLGYDPVTGRFLVGDAGQQAIWARSQQESGWSHLNPHPELARPSAMAPYGQPGLLVAGWLSIGSDGSQTAEVSLIDPHAPRSLPGRLRVGIGPVASFRPDASGRLFAVLPWAGQILRLDPR
jgi:hypothetical protein